MKNTNQITTLEVQDSLIKDREITTASQAESALMSTREMSMGVWHMINTVANDVYRSRLFPLSSPQQAAAIMLKGYEIGLGLMASFEFVQVVKGHVGLSPKGALALLHNSPRITKIKLTRLTDEKNKFIGYECTMARDNGFSHTEQWTLEDAKTAGLFKPDSNWEKYPENMCKWRAIGFCADIVAPDVTAGMVDFMIRPEQFGVRIDDEGTSLKENNALLLPVKLCRMNYITRKHQRSHLQNYWTNIQPRKSSKLTAGPSRARIKSSKG